MGTELSGKCPHSKGVNKCSVEKYSHNTSFPLAAMFHGRLLSADISAFD
jgi:hypothetical protein